MLHRDEINIHLHSVLRLSIDGLKCIRSQHYLCFVFSDATFSKLIVQMWPILSLKKHQLKPKKLAKIIAKAAGRPIDHICHYLGYLKCNQYSCKDTKSPVLRKKNSLKYLRGDYHRNKLWSKCVFIFLKVEVWHGDLGCSKTCLATYYTYLYLINANLKLYLWAN